MKFAEFVLFNEQDPPMPDAASAAAGLGAAPPMPDMGGAAGLGAAPPMPDMGGAAGLGAAPPMPGMDNAAGLGGPPMPGMDASQTQDNAPVIPQIKNVWDILSNLLDGKEPVVNQNFKPPAPELSFSNKNSPLMR